MKKEFAKMVAQKVRYMKECQSKGDDFGFGYHRVEVVGVLDLAKELNIISLKTKHWLYRKLYEI